MLLLVFFFFLIFILIFILILIFDVYFYRTLRLDDFMTSGLDDLKTSRSTMVTSKVKHVHLLKKIKKITIKKDGLILMVRHIVADSTDYAPQEMFNMKWLDWSSYLPS